MVDNICIEYESLGLIEEFSSSFFISPNPFDGPLFISMKEGKPLAVAIRNNLGQLLTSEKFIPQIK